MKKTKLFTSIAALALILSLGACEVNVDVGGVDVGDVDVGVDVNPSEDTSEDESTSESTSEDETTSESTSEGNTSENTSESGSTSESTSEPEPEPTTLSNYTLSIGIQYGGQLVEVPSYATAYIQGSWDTWTNWVALTPSSGRYEYTFETIDVDTYQYQLVLAYNDEQPGWTYRITQDGANASFTVKGSDGDSYKNEVTVTASKALTEIIPDPNAAISDVTLTIDITYNGVSQGVLDYGTLWIQGGWDSWASWVACTAVDGKYVATFDSLSPIEYEFVGVIYYTDEDLPDSSTLWDYKVNGTANATFTVSSNAVSTTLVATKALSDILPEKGEEEEEGIVFGFELNGVLNAIDGKTQSEGTYRGSYTSNLEDAVRVTYEEGETIGEYYLSFALDEATYWITIIEGDHTNLNYATEKTPIYYNPTYECWGNATQTYFLCQNATYKCLYASDISSWINSSPIAGLYNTDGTKVTGFVGEMYEEPITDIPYFEVEEPEDGNEYYLGFPYTSSGTTDWYMFNGTTDSYYDYLQCSVLGYNDPTSAVLIKTTKKTNDTWGLTFTLNSVEQTIYAWPSSNNSYGEITFTPTASLGSAKSGAVTEFGWDKDNGCFTVTLSNGDWYFETYQGKSCVSLAKSSTNYARAHLYTANPEYEVPQHEDSGIEYSSPTSFTADAIIAEYPEYTLGSGSGSQAASVQLEGKTTTLGEVSIAWGEGGTSGVRLWSASPNQIRVYKGTTDTIISVSEGYKLESISLTVNSSGNGLSGFTVTGGTISVSSTSATISVTGDTIGLTLPSEGTNTYFTEILVYYTVA